MVQPGQISFFIGMGNYLMIFNLLDWPAGVVPVTKVTEQDVDGLQNFQTRDDLEEYVKQVCRLSPSHLF